MSNKQGALDCAFRREMGHSQLALRIRYAAKRERISMERAICRAYRRSDKFDRSGAGCRDHVRPSAQHAR